VRYPIYDRGSLCTRLMRGSKRDSHHHLVAAGCAVRRARAAGGCRERGVRTRSLVCRQAAHRSSQRCIESTGAHISERLKGDLRRVRREGLVPDDYLFLSFFFWQSLHRRALPCDDK
jgi:hypothetical protein